MSEFKWGTITAASPLRVKLDGDTAALPFTPDSLVDPSYLGVGDRVRCELSSRRVILIGRSQGIAHDTGWLAYLPTVTNITVGNGTLVGRYRQRGKTVEFFARFQMGSTSAMGTNPTIGLPVTGAAQNIPVTLSGQILDAGNTYFDVMLVFSPSSVSVWFGNTAGTAASLGVISATAPMTWAVTDWMQVGGVYECV